MIQIRGFYVSLLLLLLCSVTVILAADVTYSVIVNSPDTDTGVVVNNKIYTLQLSSKSNILYQGTAPSDATYYYVKLQKGTTTVIEREEFERPALKATNSLNEFYDRNWNTKPLATFDNIPSISKNFNRRPDNTLLHPIGEIPTIQINAAQSDIDKIHKDYSQDINISANITYISTNTVQTFSNANFEIGGRSSRMFTKFGYNIKLPKKDNQYFGGYKKLKLRTTQSDPSYMREYLNTEMLNAANQPSSRASYVRVFLNNRAVGLYSLLEKYDETWLANEFGPKEASAGKYDNGIMYEGRGGKKDEKRADLSYKGDNLSAYNASAYEVAENPSKGPKNDFTELMLFTKFIQSQLNFQKANSNNVNAIENTTTEWEQRIDVEGFLVNIAFEFLQGDWDAHLQNTNNYFLYKSPAQNRFIYIAWDFDYIMGSGPVNMKAISVGDYKSYSGIQVRPLAVALLNIPSYRSLFEKHLQSIIDTLYVPSKSFPVIDSVVDLIQEDVAWDKSIPHIRKGSYFLDTITGLLQSDPNSDAGTPISFSALTAAEFVLRIDADISFSKAVNGNTGHASLYGIKEWIKLKLDNYKNKTTYKPLLGSLPILNKIL